MQKDVLSELNAAIQAAQQEVGASTDENIAKVAVRLRKATTEAQTSIEAYRELQAAIDKALEAYGDGSQSGAEEFAAAIQSAQSTVNNLEVSLEDLALAVTQLETATLAFSLANATGTAPTVVTDTRYARGSTMAFGRSTIRRVHIRFIGTRFLLEHLSRTHSIGQPHHRIPEQQRLHLLDERFGTVYHLLHTCIRHDQRLRRRLWKRNKSNHVTGGQDNMVLQ